MQQVCIRHSPLNLLVYDTLVIYYPNVCMFNFVHVHFIPITYTHIYVERELCSGDHLKRIDMVMILEACIQYLYFLQPGSFELLIITLSSNIKLVVLCPH